MSNLKRQKKIYDLLIEKVKISIYLIAVCMQWTSMRMESGFLHWGHDISPRGKSISSRFIFYNKQ
jgi:glycine cleavage system aminomethyltransferase T